jgi:hypothetical protein
MEGLRLEIAPRGLFDVHGFAPVGVKFAVPFVSGAFDSWIERLMLQRFVDGLTAMSGTLDVAASAELFSSDDDYNLSLRLATLGHIIGAYRFTPSAVSSFEVRVSGVFRPDQSYLPGLVHELNELVEQLGGRGSL